MTKRVEFWFDVGSPYSYLAYKALPKIAAARGATIDWRPMLLGGVFKATGNQSPVTVPAKGRWTAVDLQRWAKRLDAPFKRNPHFPINTLVLMRGLAGLLLRKSQAEFERHLAAIFSAMWENPRNLGDEAELRLTLGDAGLDADAFLAIANDPQVKEKLKADTEEAVARGVFGAPSFFVGDELFWGQDRLDFVDEALARA
jgi:2-hydroxychromene-2-carboxylate isomerase